jgi:hypothetical protein
MFTTVFWITATAFVTATAGIIAALPVIWEPSKKGRIKFNFRGYIFIACSILLVILPAALYVIQSRSDKEERDARDAALRKDYLTSVTKQQQDYRASVMQIRKDFGDSSYRTEVVIAQILSIQRDSLDIANKRIIKLMHDSGNIKTVLPDQPVLDVMNMQEGKEGFKFIKYEDGVFHYSINVLSQDGASCCYNLKLSAVALDSASNQLAYIGPIRSGLTATDDLAKFGAYQWTFQISYPRLYDWLYLWVRGTYSDREGKHTYTIDKVYYNRKGPNTGGSMGGDTRKSVIYIVHLFEK